MNNSVDQRYGKKTRNSSRGGNEEKKTFRGPRVSNLRDSCGRRELQPFTAIGKEGAESVQAKKSSMARRKAWHGSIGKSNKTKQGAENQYRWPLPEKIGQTSRNRAKFKRDGYTEGKTGH